MIRKEHYGAVQLTPEGVRESNRIFTEYTLLYAFFLQRLGVPPAARGGTPSRRSAAFTAESRGAADPPCARPSFAEES